MNSCRRTKDDDCSCMNVGHTLMPHQIGGKLQHRICSIHYRAIISLPAQKAGTGLCTSAENDTDSFVTCPEKHHGIVKVGMCTRHCSCSHVSMGKLANQTWPLRFTSHAALKCLTAESL